MVGMSLLTPVPSMFPPEDEAGERHAKRGQGQNEANRLENDERRIGGDHGATDGLKNASEHRRAYMGSLQALL